MGGHSALGLCKTSPLLIAMEFGFLLFTFYIVYIVLQGIGYIWVNTARMDILPKTGHILFDFESLL